MPVHNRFAGRPLAYDKCLPGRVNRFPGRVQPARGGHGVLGVLGAVGGVGTSSLAAAIAAGWRRGTLVDLDRCGGGLDVALGIDGRDGVRWSGLHASGGRIDPVDLARRLPRWQGVSVLAADGADIAPDALRSVLAAAPASGPVVVDLGRGDAEVQQAALDRLDALVVMGVADLRGVTAVHAAVRRRDGPCVAVLRRAELARAEAAAVTGVPVLALLSATVRRRGGGQLSSARGLRRAGAAVVSWAAQSVAAESVSAQVSVGSR